VLVASGIGKLDERLMHPHTRRFACRRHRSNAFEEPAAATPAAAASGTRRHERQLRFHLGVLREVLRHRHVDGAAAVLEPVAVHLSAEVEGVANEEIGHVDEDASAGIAFGSDVESPQDRPGEGVANRATLVRI
jgi:hypothetical protein